jgi:hypothetical protein
VVVGSKVSSDGVQYVNDELIDRLLTKKVFDLRFMWILSVLDVPTLPDS